jgi:hypothetical protein
MVGVGKGTISRRNVKEFNCMHTRRMRKGIKNYMFELSKKPF